MTFPLVSIIIPCYNSGAALRESIDSAILCGYDNVEIIVVNDGSTDTETLHILNEMSFEKVRIVHQENQGASASRNRGINEAKGVYILPLDADDKLASGFLTQAVNLLEKQSHIAMVAGQVELFGDQTGLYKLKPFSIENLLRANMVTVSSLYRKEDALRIGGYDTTFKKGIEDWDFAIGLVENDREIIVLDILSLYYRQHAILPSANVTQQAHIHKRDNLFKLIQKHASLYLKYPEIMCDLLYDADPERFFPKAKKFVFKTLRRHLFRIRFKKTETIITLFGITFYKK